MLVRTSDEVADGDGLIDLVGAMVKKALADYKLGPGCTPKQHNNYLSTQRFLVQAGLVRLADPDEEFCIDEVV